MKKPQKRLTVDLDDDLHRDLKVLSAMRGEDMSHLVREMIKDYVKKTKKGRLLFNVNHFSPRTTIKIPVFPGERR